MRRTAVEMDIIRAAIHVVLESYHPMTVRQCFYQMVSWAPNTSTRILMSATPSD
jgi:hypothetical protein